LQYYQVKLELTTARHLARQGYSSENDKLSLSDSYAHTVGDAYKVSLLPESCTFLLLGENEGLPHLGHSSPPLGCQDASAHVLRLLG